jgi:hypothetical protein
VPYALNRRPDHNSGQIAMVKRVLSYDSNDWLAGWLVGRLVG